MRKEDVINLIRELPIIEKTEAFEYNPLEEFVKRTREKEICHTAIIADLLDPYGKHQMGGRFLSSLLRYLKPQLKVENIEDLSSYDSVKVKKERPVHCNGKNTRYIDICIELEKDNERFAIIIENKINNAKEQPDQIRDYKDRLEQEKIQVLITICLQGTSAQNIGADLNISLIKLSEILERESNNTFGIKSYIALLKNMDREECKLKNAEIIWDCEDDVVVKKAREIAWAFEVMYKQAFGKIICALNVNEKGLNFKEERYRGENKGNIYLVANNRCLQLWNEEAYHDQNGTNHGFWLEIWFQDYNRFEIWIAQDPEKDLKLPLDLHHEN